MYSHKEYVKEHRKKNPEMYREAQRKYLQRVIKTDAYRARQRRYQKRVREKVLAAYGNQCICCAESEIMFLEMDHMANDGAAHRRTIGASIYFWLHRNKYPEGFQILCCNCNKGKYFNGGTCPHQRAD